MPELKAPIGVLLTGAAGQVAYSLLPMIGSGEVFGADQPVSLQLFDRPERLSQLEGVVMEVIDCVYPLVVNVFASSDYSIAFRDVSAAFMMASADVPKPVIHPDQITAETVRMTKEDACALNMYARADALVLVVTSPVSNAVVTCMRYANKIPRENFSALNRLTLNRTTVQIAQMLNVNASTIEDIIVWGSPTVVTNLDVRVGIINFKGLMKISLFDLFRSFRNLDVLRYLVNVVNVRTAQIKQLRPMGIGLSPACAIKDQMRDWWLGTKNNTITCMSVVSSGEYGVPKNVFFTFPVRIKDKKWEIIPCIQIGRELSDDIYKYCRHLQAERANVILACEDDS